MPKGKKKTESRGAGLEEYLEGTVFLDLWRDKMFLGQEFLTWLYLTSEKNNHFFELPGGDGVEAFFENRLTLSHGRGNNRRSVAITTTEEPRDPDWDEAYTAIGNNKRVIKGTLRVKAENREWRLTLPHDTLSPQGVKLSAVKDPAETDDLGKAGKFLDKIALTAELVSIVDELFSLFLSRRLSETWLTEDVPRLKEYLSSRT
ncbi:MAG: hypothetical protein LBF41_04190 [Deltaproteobacteria bacterium]|nr:hypothetical protein [Deltaproteobacteria bacterium]